MLAVPRVTVAGRVAVSLQELDQAEQAAERLSVVARRPLAPHPVGEELTIHQAIDPVDGLVDVVGLAQDPSRDDHPPQERRVHVPQERLESAARRPRSARKKSSSMRRFIGVVDLAARADQVVGADEVLGDIHVGPPRPLRRAVIR